MSQLGNNMSLIARLVGGEENMPRPRSQATKLQRNKNGNWFIRPYTDGIKNGVVVRTKKTILVGAATMLKRDAIVRANALMATINRADYILESHVPFTDLLDKYIRGHVEKQAASTQGKYGAHIKNHVRPAFGHLKLHEISTKLIQEWLDDKAKAGLSWATRTDLRNLMSGIFNRAIAWGDYRDRNPVEAVSAGRKRIVREKRKLTDEQTRRFLAALPYDVRLMCCTCLFCGLRISEVLGVQEKHLDFDRSLVMIRQRYYRGDIDTPKSDKSRRDVSLGYLAADIKRTCTGDPERFVFEVHTAPQFGRKEGICRDDRDINQHFLRPAAKTLGIYRQGFGFHVLRREAVTEIGSVLGIGQAMDLVGHSRTDMTLLYTLKDKDAQDRAIRNFQERILGKPEGSVN